MAITPSDYAGRTVTVLGRRIALPCATVAASTIFSTPGAGAGSSAVLGEGRCFVLFVQMENFTGNGPTVSYGSSAVPTDWIAATAVTASGNPVVFIVGATSPVYGPGINFQSNVTVAGTGTMDITVWGFQY